MWDNETQNIHIVAAKEILFSSSHLIEMEIQWRSKNSVSGENIVISGEWDHLWELMPRFIIKERAFSENMRCKEGWFRYGRRMSALRHYDAELRHLALDFQGWKETRFDMSGKNLSSHQVRATSQQDDLLRLAKFWEIRLLRSHASAKCCKKRQAVNRKCLRRLGGIRRDTWLQSAENLHQFRPSQTVTSVRHYVWCHFAV